MSHILWSTYRAGMILLAALFSITVFILLMSAPSKLGLHELIIERYSEGVWIFIIGLPSALLFLFGPIYAAGWIFRTTLVVAAKAFKKNENH